MSSLVAELEAAGEVEARGGFSIDSDKAREKLRQYQLAEPLRYVLLLVEAAFSAGATALDFQIDSDDLHLRFGGAVFTYEQLENIYGSLFAEHDEIRPEDLTRLRGLQQLAFAINSAMALNPRYVRVVSVDAEGCGVALELRPDRPDEITRVEDQPPGNWIHVKDRLRPGLIVEFFRSVRDQLDEVLMLREHCRWSRLPIHVNGEQVSGAMGFEREPWAAVDVVDGGQSIGRVMLGMMEKGSEGELVGAVIEPKLLTPTAYLVSNGVHIELQSLAERGVRGLAAIVDSPRFGKDVSQTKLLHDAGYDEVIDAIIAGQDHAIARLVEARLAKDAPSWADEVLHEWLSKRMAGERTGKRRDKLRRMLAEDPVFAAVAEVPLWEVIGVANITTRELIETDGPLRHASVDFDFAPVDVPFVLRPRSGVSGALLQQLFGARLHDYTSALRREWERQRKRLEFMTRPHLPELGEGYYLVREPIRAELREGDTVTTIHGELGLRSVGHRDGWVRLLTEGCLLREQAIDGPLPGLCAVVSAPFEPNDDYDQARPTRALAVALVAVLEALERALARLAGAGTITAQHVELRALLRIYIQQACRRDLGLAFLNQFAFVRKQAKRELDRMVGAFVPSWGLDGPSEDQHPLLRVPLYDRAHAGPCTLASLVARRAEGQRLAWLDVGAGSLPALDVEVLLIEQADREALRELLGNSALCPFAEELARIRCRDAFLERAQVELALPHATLARVSLPGEGADLRGELGLREYAFSATGEGRTPVRVYHLERELCELELELPLPGLSAWVEDATFEVNPTFEDLQHPISLRRPLLAGLVALVELELERAREQPMDLLLCEWWFLAMVPNVVFGAGGLVRAFMILHHELGRALALIELEGLLELLERFPARDIDRAIGTLRGRGERPTAEAVRGHLKRPTRRPSQSERDLLFLRRGLASVLDALLELPLLRSFTDGSGTDGSFTDGSGTDGSGTGAQRGTAQPRRVTLDALFARVGAGEPISWVSEDFRLESAPSIDVEVVVLDFIEHPLLAKLFGGAALELVNDWLVGRARFERRRTISEVRVARGSALVVITLDGDGVRGELGISAEPPREVVRSKIRVFTEAREVALLDLPARSLALVGALEFDELELNQDHDDITAAERERVRKLVQRHTDALLTELATRYAGLERRDQARAAEVVRHLLVEWPPGVGGYKARANKRRPMFMQLAELPVFAGARKPWSALELAEARERGRIATLAYRRPKLEAPDGPIVVLDSPDVEGTLRALFGDIRDLDRELERKRELVARRAAAPKMPSQPPANAMGSIAVAGEGLDGWLWLVSDHAQVMFGEDGRAADQRAVSDVCWCGGAIWGPGLSIAKDWNRAILSRSQERLLERRGCELWGSLIGDFERRSEAEPPRDADARRAHLDVRDALHGLFMRLHARCGGGRQSKRKRKRKQGNRYEKLYERVRDLAVLELSTGRWISAEIAERERPIELASLELWVGPSAEEKAHQRAVEQRDAKRERERHNKRERERRRAEAQARERESARRRSVAREARRRAEREADAKAKTRSAAASISKTHVEAKPEGPRPEQLLLEALREELRLVRAFNGGLVSNRHLESLVLGEARRRGSLFRQGDGQTELDVGHPLFEAVLEGYLDDQGLLTLLASSAYTYLNIVHAEIEDQHEAEFLRLHAAYAATSLAVGVGDG